MPVADYGGLCYMGWLYGLYSLNCLGETRDSSYLTPLTSVILNEYDFLILIGVNHNQTNLATYMNIGLYNFDEKVGIKGIEDKDMINSANYFLKNTTYHSLQQQFYVLQIAYNCTNIYFNNITCIELPSINWPKVTSGINKIWNYRKSLFTSRYINRT